MKKIISIMLCIMLSVSMMTACGSKESDNDKKDVGSWSGGTRSEFSRKRKFTN